MLCPDNSAILEVGRTIVVNSVRFIVSSSNFLVCCIVSSNSAILEEGRTIVVNSVRFIVSSSNFLVCCAQITVPYLRWGGPLW